MTHEIDVGRGSPSAGAVPRWLARGEHDVPAGGGWLSTAEAAWAAGMHFTKRRTEFLVARWTAKQAIAAALGLACDAGTWARVDVRHHSSGAPEAYLDGRPLGLTISLSDRAGWAVCLLGPNGDPVGCDLELVEPRSPAFVRDYLTDDEQALVAGVDDLGRQLAANLLWSAKESTLKVLRTGLRRDTRSVQVTVPGPLEGATGWSPLSVRADEGDDFSGWWCRFGEFVLTVASTAPMPAPLALDEPPALAAAVPTHTWLAHPVQPDPAASPGG